MKKITLLTTVFLIIASCCLVALKGKGLHPNFNAMAVLVPIVYLYAWAMGTIWESRNTKIK